ncbi:MAG: hypothetical protein HQ503_16835 [Rhodospirillales bacterium]|nr:hypothetical protein [Rhodospirillales bacterium]
MEIGLSAGVRTSLQATQKISALLGRTQERISTGRKYNSIVQNPIAVSLSNSLSNRASDLLTVKDTIGQAASRLNTTAHGLDAINGTLDQLKAVAQQYGTTNSATEKTALSAQFDELKNQLDNFARDSSYGGTNLIDNPADNLNVILNEDGSSQLTITGQASDATTLGVVVTDSSTIDAAKAQIRSTAQAIGTQGATIAIREEFTTNLVNTLKDGEAKLVEIDLNEEAATTLSLQTRNQLSIAATAIAVQSERSILQLF